MSEPIDKEFRRRILLYALVSTPVLSFYGVSPFLIFDILSVSDSLTLVALVGSSVVFYWLINGLLFLRLQKPMTVGYILLSFILSFLSNALKFPFEFLFQFRPTMEQYYLYPITISVALNIIILILIKAIIGEQEKRRSTQLINQLNIQKLEAQKQVLMQQIQPHFLFNALSVLKSLIQENTEQAEFYTYKLSQFLRYSVASNQVELVKLQEELEFVNNYIDLQKIRFENAFDYQVDIPTPLLQSQVPVLAVQTLVENVFKHNYFTEERPIKIKIEAKEEAVIVWNTLGSVKVTDRKGTGLDNLTKRYQLIAAVSPSVTQTDESFAVTLPLIRS